MNTFWSLLGYQQQQQEDEKKVIETALIAEVSGTIKDYKISILSLSSDTFIINSLTKKKYSSDEYKITLELNNDSNFAKWLTAFGSRKWNGVESSGSNKIEWRSGDRDVLKFCLNRTKFDYELLVSSNSANKVILKYIDDEKSEYAILILRE